MWDSALQCSHCLASAELRATVTSMWVWWRRPCVQKSAWGGLLTGGVARCQLGTCMYGCSRLVLLPSSVLMPNAVLYTSAQTGPGRLPAFSLLLTVSAQLLVLPPPGGGSARTLVKFSWCLGWAGAQHSDCANYLGELVCALLLFGGILHHMGCSFVCQSASIGFSELKLK